MNENYKIEFNQSTLPNKLARSELDRTIVIVKLYTTNAYENKNENYLFKFIGFNQLYINMKENNNTTFIEFNESRTPYKLHYSHPHKKILKQWC